MTQKCSSKIRNVITLGSPLRHAPDATHATFFFELVSGMDADCVSLSSMLKPHRSVPLTSLFTKNDGLVGWETSANLNHAKAEAVEIVGTSHLGIVAHPGAFYMIADRLKQEKHDWKPYQPKELWEERLFIPHQPETIERDSWWKEMHNPMDRRRRKNSTGK